MQPKLNQKAATGYSLLNKNDSKGTLSLIKYLSENNFSFRITSEIYVIVTV